MSLCKSLHVSVIFANTVICSKRLNRWLVSWWRGTSLPMKTEKEVCMCLHLSVDANKENLYLSRSLKRLQSWGSHMCFVPSFCCVGTQETHRRLWKVVWSFELWLYHKQITWRANLVKCWWTGSGGVLVSSFRFVVQQWPPPSICAVSENITPSYLDFLSGGFWS